jgi:carotenoid cleavage dioxygenase-like enzyme
MKETKPNFALNGNFATILEKTSKIVEGAPADLNGCYLRNGPNTIYLPPSGRHHMFDGDGMLHCIRLKDGTAQYCNRYIQTPKYLREHK